MANSWFQKCARKHFTIIFAFTRDNFVLAHDRPIFARDSVKVARNNNHGRGLKFNALPV